MRLAFATAAAVLVAVSAPAAATNLIGQSVSSTFTSNVGTANLVQFTSPQVVGAGTEFTGSFTDVFSQNWSISVDVNATGFSFSLQDGVNGNVRSGNANGALKIELTGLAGIGSLQFLSYVCAPPGFSCNAFSGGPDIVSSGSDATSAFVWISTLRNGETYTFSLSDAVPEPASWAMMIAGFGLAGAAMRRKSVRVAFAA